MGYFPRFIALLFLIIREGVFVEAIWKLNGVINGIVWPWMLTLLVGTGVWFTFILWFSADTLFRGNA